MREKNLDSWDRIQREHGSAKVKDIARPSFHFSPSKVTDWEIYTFKKIVLWQGHRSDINNEFYWNGLLLHSSFQKD